jgi:hypothetical protein
MIWFLMLIKQLKMIIEALAAILPEAGFVKKGTI